MSYGLYPTKRPYQKPKHRIDNMIKDVAKMEGVIGPMWHLSGGACCIPCKRYVEPGLIHLKRQPRRVLPNTCCDYCGRTPLDQDLMERGVIAVAREYSAEAIKLRLQEAM